MSANITERPKGRWHIKCRPMVFRTVIRIVSNVIPVKYLASRFFMLERARTVLGWYFSGTKRSIIFLKA